MPPFSRRASRAWHSKPVYEDFSDWRGEIVHVIREPMPPQRRTDRSTVRDEVLLVRLTRAERTALREWVRRCQQVDPSTTESSEVRGWIRRELLKFGVLQLPPIEAPPGVDPLVETARQMLKG